MMGQKVLQSNFYALKQISVKLEVLIGMKKMISETNQTKLTQEARDFVFRALIKRHPQIQKQLIKIQKYIQRNPVQQFQEQINKKMHESLYAVVRLAQKQKKIYAKRRLQHKIRMKKLEGKRMQRDQTNDGDQIKKVHKRKQDQQDEDEGERKQAQDISKYINF